jgi:cation transport ATPase
MHLFRVSLLVHHLEAEALKTLHRNPTQILPPEPSYQVATRKTPKLRLDSMMPLSSCGALFIGLLSPCLWLSVAMDPYADTSATVLVLFLVIQVVRDLAKAWRRRDNAALLREVLLVGRAVLSRVDLDMLRQLLAEGTVTRIVPRCSCGKFGLAKG